MLSTAAHPPDLLDCLSEIVKVGYVEGIIGLGSVDSTLLRRRLPKRELSLRRVKLAK